jgi:L-methionine (R)-S-oxide reductase
MIRMQRPYQHLLQQITDHADRESRMQAFVDLLWPALSPTGVSWLGFYLHHGDQLILGPRRDKPACSPIGMHGVCGQAFLQRCARIVADVRELGSDYVACDPRDMSEVVIPCMNSDGSCWGVLDLDSHAVGAFTQSDADGLTSLLLRATLTA